MICMATSNTALFCSFSSVCSGVFDRKLFFVAEYILRTKLEGAYPAKREHFKNPSSDREEIQ